MKKNVSFEIDAVEVVNPEARNFIFGLTHFIKSVEDIHEAVVNCVPGVRFGLAFAEASGPRLVRTSGNSADMTELALKNTLSVGCGHTFFLFLENAFPINVLPALRTVPELVSIFCATANPVSVIVARTGAGRGVLGVVDGGSPLGVEDEQGKKQRRNLLRKFGYKL
ncbi:hypothetical protein A2Z33_01510 [Candidatus Gottesmanbacteria bacterium RBG_16_52_11]|uniref:Adenosine monophosphate-protein transferase n=1 Tax=Candidatus Gottesmanbacteria bacterium RBG_16_52_11 TaxID=1798374 RepID=A0A1F5YNX7_9BACT|nr:MAG: hypothetical protein A2Z33_01510 [Candidatus Gottesmanbacteria bacterium RBG_16_52_11]